MSSWNLKGWSGAEMRVKNPSCVVKCSGLKNGLFHFLIPVEAAPPQTAQNILCIPCDISREHVTQYMFTLQSGYTKYRQIIVITILEAIWLRFTLFLLILALFFHLESSWSFSSFKSYSDDFILLSQYSKIKYCNFFLISYSPTLQSLLTFLQLDLFVPNRVLK